MSLVAIILAAGKGTRMASDLPKVLHPIDGTPLVMFPIEAARAAGASQVVVVVGYEGDRVREEVSKRLDDDSAWLSFATQEEQLGTGHAVMCGLPALGDATGVALVLSGDVPLLTAETVQTLAKRCREVDSGVALTTFRPDELTGYGRILRDEQGRVKCIREDRDASEEERRVGECNAGTYAVQLEHLRADLPRLGRNNAQGEIYLTDLVELAAERGEVAAVEIDPSEAAGVNTQEQLAELEAVLIQRRQS